MNVTITVNGKRIQADVPAGQTLLQFLREQGYRSVKCGCETTNCGLCSVWMDEKKQCCPAVCLWDARMVSHYHAGGCGKRGKGICGFYGKRGGGAMWILFTGNDDAGACHEKGKQDLDR
mgnify:CR=1 FL=1